MHIRPAELDDAESLAAIYNAEVVGSTATFDLIPRSLEEQREWLSARQGAHLVLVAEESAGTGAIGYASLSPFRDRPAYNTSVESSVYVHSEHRGKGIAFQLMSELLSNARLHGFHAVVARIADSQTASLGLHTKLGFELVGVEREIGRKFGRWLDVSVMQVLL